MREASIRALLDALWVHLSGLDARSSREIPGPKRLEITDLCFVLTCRVSGDGVFGRSVEVGLGRIRSVVTKPDRHRNNADNLRRWFEDVVADFDTLGLLGDRPSEVPPAEPLPPELAALLDPTRRIEIDHASIAVARTERGDVGDILLSDAAWVAKVRQLLAQRILAARSTGAPCP